MTSSPFSPPRRASGRPRKIQFTPEQATRLRYAMIRYGAAPGAKLWDHGVIKALREMKGEFPKFAFESTETKPFGMTKAARSAVQSIINSIS